MTPLPLQPPCECPGPGFCARYQIQQTAYAWRVCACVSTEDRPVTEARSARMRQVWADRRDGKRTGKHHGTAKAAATKSVLATAAKSTKQTSSKPRIKRPPCGHLGKATGETLPCKVCGGGDGQVSVFACGLHTECTLRKLLHRPGEQNLACCAICKDYRAAEEVRSGDQ